METAAYGFLKGIDYVTEECPMSLDATSLVYKEALSLIEEKMPGTRRNFYQGFLQQNRDVPENPDASGKCISCDAPTYTETCSYCRLKERVTKA
jgi:tRNA(Ile)-lysidine synthase TilS/MesJ